MENNLPYKRKNKDLENQALSDKIGGLQKNVDIISVYVENFRQSGDTDDSVVIQRAIDSVGTNGSELKFSNKIYNCYTPIDLKNNIKFSGVHVNKTIVKYLGASGTALFKVPTTIAADKSAQFLLLFQQFSNITFYGNGNSRGSGATVDFLRLGDITDTTNLYDIPFLRMYNCQVKNFKKGIYLEGYGHTLQDTYIKDCLDGLTIVHPEQVTCDNVWIEYCDVGLKINPDEKFTKAGHHFDFRGGAIQQNRIGAILQNVYEAMIDTYCEGNSETDIYVGTDYVVDGSHSYAKGCHGTRLIINSASRVSNANIDIYASTGVDITLSSWRDDVTSVPHVKADGYSKHVDVKMYTESTKSSVPYNIASGCMPYTRIFENGVKKYLGAGWVDKSYTMNGTEYYKQAHGSFNGVDAVTEILTNAKKVIKLMSGNNTTFTVMDNNANIIFNVSLVNNTILKGKHLLIQGNGKGFVLDDANGNHWLYTANTDGTLNIQSTSITF